MTRKLYCCATDWLHEIGEAPDLEGRMPFFSSVEKLKEAKLCWNSCGIVEINSSQVLLVYSGGFDWQTEQLSKELGELEDEEK